MVGIYRITSPSGRVYIGQSKNIGRRFTKYRRLDCVKQPIIYNSLKKYGSENHIFEILVVMDYIDQRLLDELEISLIEYYMNVGISLNGKVGGLFGGVKHTDETKEKLRKANLGKKVSDETKRKISEAQIGRKLTERQKKNMYGRSPSNNKRIIQLDLDDNIIQYFDTILSAFKYIGKEYCGNISKCCSGKVKTAYGYKWRYAD